MAHMDLIVNLGKRALGSWPKGFSQLSRFLSSQLVGGAHAVLLCSLWRDGWISHGTVAGPLRYVDSAAC